MLCQKWLKDSCSVIPYSGCFGVVQECLTPEKAEEIMEEQFKELEVVNVGN